MCGFSQTMAQVNEHNNNFFKPTIKSNSKLQNLMFNPQLFFKRAIDSNDVCYWLNHLTKKISSGIGYLFHVNCNENFQNSTAIFNSLQPSSLVLKNFNQKHPKTFSCTK